MANNGKNCFLHTLLTLALTIALVALLFVLIPPIDKNASEGNASKKADTMDRAGIVLNELNDHMIDANYGVISQVEQIRWRADSLMALTEVDRT